MVGWVWKTEVTRVWLIEHESSNLLAKKCIVVSGNERKRFQQALTRKTVKGTFVYHNELFVFINNGWVVIGS